MINSHALLRLSRHLFAEGNRVGSDVEDLTVERCGNGYRVSFSVSDDLIDKTDHKVTDAIEILMHIIDLIDQKDN